MPSFDIVNKVDLQTLDNTVNIAKKEIDNRYDFKGTSIPPNFTISFDAIIDIFYKERE